MCSKIYYFNRNNKIILSKKTENEMKRGKEKSMKKIGGICSKGLGKLIFYCCNGNSFGYNQVLNKINKKIFFGKKLVF